MEQPCIQVENSYICRQEEIKFHPEEDCVSSLILNKKPQCQPIPVQPPKLIFNRINEEYLIIVTEERINLKARCPDLEYLAIKGSALIQVPMNCSLEYQEYHFGSSKQEVFGKPLILPGVINCHLTLEEGKYDFLFLVLRRNTIFQSELKSAQTFQR
ncbi:unnamed protein product [Callosobruchus maculatus]|uniref:Uncharacterized protein n=1 Tax=Callosobruchus maculatus TaxID=64391 RepID=A0A653CS00_CALMS|nr:unnamed protein product [Callosobruchus maculatus]